MSREALTLVGLRFPELNKWAENTWCALTLTIVALAGPRPRALKPGVDAALESRKVISKRFGAIKTTSIEEELAFQSADKSRVAKAVAESDIANKVFWDEMRPVADEFQRALRAYLTAVNIYLGGGT